jgi:hypothetical protein
MQREIAAVTRRYQHLDEFWTAVEQLAGQIPAASGET